MWPFKDYATKNRMIKKEVLSAIRQSDLASRLAQNGENDAAWKMNIWATNPVVGTLFWFNTISAFAWNSQRILDEKVKTGAILESDLPFDYNEFDSLHGNTFSAAYTLEKYAECFKTHNGYYTDPKVFPEFELLRTVRDDIIYGCSNSENICQKPWDRTIQDVLPQDISSLNNYFPSLKEYYANDERLSVNLGGLYLALKETNRNMRRWQQSCPRLFAHKDFIQAKKEIRTMTCYASDFPEIPQSPIEGSENPPKPQWLSNKYSSICEQIAASRSREARS